MDLRNDPFFEDVAPPTMPGFPHMGLGSRHHSPLALSPFGGMGMGMGLMPFGGHSPFSMMNGMMSNMDSMMRNMQREAQQGHCFSSSTSTVMHYSADGQGGAPQVYHATSSTRQGPGGVKETRKAVKDSRSGTQRMAVGHHIGDRSHVIERHINARTGERAENQEFVNLDDTDADAFSHEWREKTHSINPTLHHPGLESSRRNHFSNSRGLPCSSSRPCNPVEPGPEVVGSRVQVEREGGKRERGEGGRSNKRKHRSESLSGEDDQVHGSATSYPSATHRSPKLSRTKSPPPYIPKPSAAAPQFHSHSGHTHTTSAQLHTNPKASTTVHGAKKTDKKKTISFDV